MKSPPERFTLRTLVLLSLLWLAGLCAAAQFAKIATVFLQISELYGDRGPEIGFLVSSLSIVGIVFGLFSGLLIARFGFRKLLLPALIFGAVLSFLQAALPGFAFMLVTRVLEGISHLVIVVAAPTLMAQLSPAKHRGLVMSIWSTFFGVAFVLTAYFGLPLVEAWGLPTLFVAHGIFTALSAALLFLLLPGQILNVEKTPLSLHWLWQAHVAAYRSPRIAAPAFGWLVYTLTYVSILTVLPTFIPVEDRASAATTMPLAGLVSALLVGLFLLPRMSALNTVLVGFVAAAAIAIWLPFAQDRALAAIVLFAALGLVQAGSFALVPELLDRPEDQARANGAMAQMGNLGNSVGTPLLLALTYAFGALGVLIFAVCAYLLGIALHIWCAMRRSGGIA